MENEFYQDGFESFLKENADDFLMVPSRKVWYSIYNNKHPDRKWPSMAVCLIILSAVLYIGISNNNSLSSASQKAGAANFTGNIAEIPGKKSTKQNNNSPFTKFKNNTPSNYSNLLTIAGKTDADLTGSTDPAADIADNFTNTYQNNTDFAAVTKIGSAQTGNMPDNANTVTSSKGRHAQLSVAARSAVSVKGGEVAIDENLKAINNATKNTAADLTTKNTESAVPAESKKKKQDETIIAKLTADDDRSWKEDYAFRNKPSAKKLAGKGSISYYVTPSFGYRGFFKNREARYAALYNTPSGKEKLNDGAALNLEIGAMINYTVSRNTRLKAGLQANYTNYVSRVTGLDHPTQTSLAVDDNGSSFRSSQYAVKEGLSKLNKTTIQLSIPIGADVKLAGRKKIKWYAGGTFQPTYVITGSAYVLSADGNNYISETPLLRKLNLNAAIETFVTFKPSSGVILSLGPQFRYQLLSTYKKEYNYTEKLYNVGFKIGITTDF